MVEIEGTYEVDAEPKLVWEMVLDPDVLSRVMPGCEKLERINDNEYSGKMRIKVGPVDGIYQGKLTLSELRSIDSFHLAVNGRGASGNIRGEGDVKLEPTESGGTLLRYVGQGEVSGRMATVGQRLTQSSASAITKQCLQNLDRQIEARVEPQPTEDVSEGEGALAHRQSVMPEPPSQTEFAIGVAQELLDEYIPDANQQRLLLGFATLSLFILLMNWFANVVARRVVKKLQEDHELH